MKRPEATWRPYLHVELLMLGTGIYFAAACNRAFFGAVADTGAFDSVGGWTLAVCLFVAIAMAHALLLALVPGRVTAKLVLSALLLAAAMASYAASTGDAPPNAAAMQRGLEAAPESVLAWMAPKAILHVLLLAGPPITAIWWIRLVPRNWPTAAAARAGLIVAASAVFLLGVQLPAHTVSQLRQQHPELTQRITPFNLVVALARVAFGDVLPPPSLQSPRSPSGSEDDPASAEDRLGALPPRHSHSEMGRQMTWRDSPASLA